MRRGARSLLPLGYIIVVSARLRSHDGRASAGKPASEHQMGGRPTVDTWLWTTVRGSNPCLPAKAERLGCSQVSRLRSLASPLVSARILPPSQVRSRVAVRQNINHSTTSTLSRHRSIENLDSQPNHQISPSFMSKSRDCEADCAHVTRRNDILTRESTNVAGSCRSESCRAAADRLTLGDNQHLASDRAALCK